MRGLMNAPEIDARGIGSGVLEMLFGVMMLAILVVEFELRQTLWLQLLLGRRKVLLGF